MPDRRVKPCAKCHHPKSRHRTRECRTTWQTRGQHSADGWAVPWRDGRDRVRWQPQRPDGRRPWLRDERYYPTDLGWYAAIEDYEGAFGPLLFRSRWQAERMAKRTWNAKLKRELNQVTEVQP